MRILRKPGKIFSPGFFLTKCKSVSPIKIFPSVGLKNLNRIFIKVVLPDPDAPTIAVTLLVSIVKEILSSAFVALSE